MERTRVVVPPKDENLCLKIIYSTYTVGLCSYPDMKIYSSFGSFGLRNHFY